MIIYVTTKSGAVFTVDKKAAEAIVYNTAAWIVAAKVTARAMIRTWDIEAIQAGDAEAEAELKRMSADYSNDCGYPFIERE